MLRLTFFTILLAVGVTPSLGCGLDWTLPTNHFDGVEEHGYVSYWEKIGEADLGDGLIIPVNINFDSHREAASPTLGKGWMVALLESHVEPVDENTLCVVMPDGWNFFFLRNGNTETWRGNAGWVGETNNTVFVISAPCGWRIKFDKGKIQEIDTSDGRELTYRYNGGIATEIDEGNKAFVRMESAVAEGAPSDIIIGARKIQISLVNRPRVTRSLKQTLLTGSDKALGALSETNVKIEAFSYDPGKNVDSNLLITQSDGSTRAFQWDPTTMKAIRDNDWTYQILDQSPLLSIKRTNSKNCFEQFDENGALGYKLQRQINGTETRTWTFVNAGVLNNKIRKVESIQSGKLLNTAKYFYNESGDLIKFSDTRQSYSISTNKDKSRRQAVTDQGLILWTEYLDPKGRLTRKEFAGGKVENLTYRDDGTIEEVYLDKGVSTILLLANNRMVSYKAFDSAGKLMTSLFNDAAESLRQKKGEQ